MNLLLILPAVMALLAGCTITYVASRYSISADNVKTLRTFKGQSVNVGPEASWSIGLTITSSNG
jgi:hypothetical protein